MNRKVYWVELITLMNESYMVIVVCLFVNLAIFSMDSPGLEFMSILCAILFTLSIVLPIFFIWQLVRNFKNLEETRYVRKFGALYEELNLSRGKKTILVPGFFLLRRMLLAVAICLFTETFIW